MRWLDNVDDNPCQMRTKIGEEWTPIKGWIEKAGALHIRNEEGNFATNPTDEERAEVMSRIIEIGIEGMAAFLIRPGESFRAEPLALRGIGLRTQHGIARCTITVFPA
jgi:hypothetical protein